MLQYCDILILSISEEIVMGWPVNIPQNKILATTNGVDIEYTQSAAKNVTEKETNGTSSLDVLYVGHVRRVRGLDTLIKATDKLSRRGDVDIRLSLVGPITNEDRVWLQQELKRRNLEGTVDICGSLAHEKALRKVALSDICVNILPQEVGNYMYAFPIKIFEYMALDKPIVSTKTVGTSRLLKDGHNSLLLPNNKPKHIADAIQQLSSDSQFRRKIAENA
jgi:glycosyltransferase involved in cell wall biosynthesis